MTHASGHLSGNSFSPTVEVGVAPSSWMVTAAGDLLMP